MTAERPRPAPNRPTPHRARLRFDRLPAAYCHPGRLAKLLPKGLPGSFQARLQGSKRLRLRLSAVLAKRFALEACTADDMATPEGRFAQLEGDDLQHALRRIGAIWHVRRIRKIILKDKLRQLIERLGRDNHRAALHFIDLAPEDDGLLDGVAADDRALDVDTLLGCIERDGLIAVNAWCRHQPAALAARLRLKLPPCPEADDEPPTSHRQRGLLIVDRVAMTLPGEHHQAAAGHG